MKQFNKIYIVSAISVILYTWLLCVVGIFGTDVADFTRTVSVFLLKWCLVILGFALAIFLPIRINFALNRNKNLAEQAEKAKQEELAILQEKKRVKQLLDDEKFKIAIAKKIEEQNAYE